MTRAVREGNLRGALAAYDRLHARDGEDPSLRAFVAGSWLLQEARNERLPSHAAEAVRALRRAGRAARPWLQALLWDEHVPALARAEAAAALARWGHVEARALLTSWREHPESRIRALSLRLASWPGARPELLHALRHGSEPERIAAADALASAAPDPVARRALGRACRRDGNPRVRRRACQALGAFGDLAEAILLERVHADDALSVRLAAVSAALRAARHRALPALRPLWSAPPSPEGIEAARWVARNASGVDRIEALATLRSALESASSSLRAQAAVAWLSVGPHLARGALRARLDREPDAAVRLQLARALLRTHRGRRRAVEALRSIGGGTGLLAAQALSDLARLRGAPGRWAAKRLTVLLAAKSPLVRLAAVRGLALDAGRPEAVLRAMLDPARSVRYAAAAALIAAAGP